MTQRFDQEGELPRMEPGPNSLVALASWINGRARQVLSEDGAHAATFILRAPDGGLEPHLFSEATERPVGQRRGREIADAVRQSEADAVALISEAWKAPEGSITAGVGAGDSPEPKDVLLVAATDRVGNLSAFETQSFRRPGGSVELGESVAHDGSSYEIGVFDAVREVWAERSRGRRVTSREAG